MSKIVSKLDLNKTPQLVDNNSLIFAKNIRVLKDGMIGPDFPIDSVLSVPGVMLGYIVGLNSTIYLFVAETSTISPLLNLNQFYAGLVPSGGTLNSYSLNISNKYVNHTYVWEKGQDLSSYATSTIISAFGGNLVRQVQATSLASHYPFTTSIEIEFSYILNDEEIFDSTSIPYTRDESNINYNIYSYNENYKTLTKIPTVWTWSGGKIHGVCTTNNTGDIILTVCEYFDNNDKLIPIKHINLSHADVDDETLYTQTPNIPFTNLKFVDYYVNPIPNGVYQFFIRYKIYKDFYTDWFPCSEECFTGNINVTNTIQGSIQYVDTTLNSDKSFIFEVEHLLNGENQDEFDYTKNFSEFQIGFIVSHDDSINARSWKHFPMRTERIYFDYDQDFIEEINIDDLLKSVYEISNVKNITYFRNKLYIANYIESNINEDLAGYAFAVNCEIVQKELTLDNSDISQKVVIDGKTFPVVDGNAGLYNLGYEGDSIITKTVTDTDYEPQTDKSGPIFKAYYKSYAGLDPDIFFLKSGVDYTILNANSVGDYTNPNVLETFCLKQNYTSGNDFEDVTFYNDKTNTASNKGRLLYHGDDHYYFRLGGQADSKRSQVTINHTKQDIYIHPLNDDINWVCAADGGITSSQKIDEINETVVGHSYKLFHLDKLPVEYENSSSLYERYKYDCRDVNWNEDTDEEARNWYIAENYISNQLLTCIKAYYPTYVLKEINLFSNNTRYPIIEKDPESPSRSITIEDDSNSINVSPKPYNDFRGICDTAKQFPSKEDFIWWCLNYVSTSVIDTHGNAYYNYNGTYKRIDRVEIKYNEFSYKLGDRSDFSDGIVDGLHGKDCNLNREIVSSVKEHSTKIYYSAKTPVISTEGNSAKINTKSLIPFTDYKFYIHYIKSNGVVTNGYQIGNTIYRLSNFDENLEHSVIYPTFDNIAIPDGYDGYFISIEKVGDNIASCFNVREVGEGDDAERVADCLEIDSMLYPLNDNITIFDSRGQIVTKEAKYYPSSTTEPAMLLGNAGCLRWKIDDEYESDSNSSDDSDEQGAYPRYWVRIKNNSENSSTNRLIKLTPYLNSDSFCVGDQTYAHNDYTRLNIPGYYCSVCKPIDISITADPDANPPISAGELYVNGSDLYNKTEIGNAIQIVDYNALMTHVDTYNTTPYYVYSNFNFTYLTLFDMSYKQVRYKRYLEIDENTGQTIENYKQMLFMLDSSTISYIYTLPSMYKDYTRKLYSSIKSDKLYIFDNVIRASDINTDEHYKYIYKFDALDYYTVPANRGKIVNLFNITQNIFIHCEHSLFKFSGDNTLTAKDTEVQLTENDIFDTGIIELFDSEHGFAGLQVKHHSLITYNAYIFYDSIANTLYAYFGENNLVKLSDSIHKILSSRNFTDVLFNADTENDRFFINFIYSDNSNLCLSYNFSTKSFVSIHDFNFAEGFFTRLDCYFLNFGKVNLFNVSKSAFTVLPDTNSSTSYSILYATSKLFISDMVIPEIVNYPVENCLDIVCNIEYEKVKLLNYINWICNQIIKYADDTDDVNLFVAEENISKYAGSKLRIYSDQCSTALIELEDNNGQIYEQNNQAITSSTSYEYPRYNCGVWSLNYFRDVKNIEDIFNYKAAIPPTQQEETNNTGLVNSDRSLIYGKYFVLRLIFRNKNFKLENINFNIQDYEKV